MADSNIEWCDKVWNPVTGCSKVSAGCKNCYAETIAKRFWGKRKFTDVQCHADRLGQPLHWRKPQRIFVNSMSDLFHEKVPFEFINLIWAVMEEADTHTFMILTKRPEQMLEYIDYRNDVTVSNIWLGVSVEDQQTADERIPLLLHTPAAERFISIEPMLNGIDLAPADPETGLRYNYLTGKFDGNDSIGNKIDWVILGGESGKNARPMHPDWVRSVRDQCLEARVPFFFKQTMLNKKLIKMPELDGKAWNEYPK